MTLPNDDKDAVRADRDRDPTASPENPSGDGTRTTGAPKTGFAHQGGATGSETKPAEDGNEPAPPPGGGTTDAPTGKREGESGNPNRDTDRGGAYDRGNGGF